MNGRREEAGAALDRWIHQGGTGQRRLGGPQLEPPGDHLELVGDGVEAPALILDGFGESRGPGAGPDVVPAAGRDGCEGVTEPTGGAADLVRGGLERFGGGGERCVHVLKIMEKQGKSTVGRPVRRTVPG